MDDLVLKEICLLTLLLDHRLEEHEDMALLPPRQLHNGLSERILILLGQWLAVLDRKMRVHVLIQRGILLLDALLLELSLEDLQDIVLVVTQRSLLAWAGGAIGDGELGVR